MFDLDEFDLEEIATALGDQTDYETRWLIDPRTGEVVFWTSELGIDGQNPVELDELDMVVVDPLPSSVWYRDMADFAARVGDEGAERRLSRALQGKGAFRLAENSLVDTESVDRYLAEHPDLAVS
jgi:hypothetical protein